MPKTLMQSVVSQLQKERTRLEDELHRVTAALTAFGKVYLRAGKSTRKKTTISAAGRKRIAAAQRARWAKIKGQKVVSIGSRKGHTMSAVARIIGDAQSVILPDGTYMQANCCTKESALLDIQSLTWKSTGKGKYDVNDEEGWTLLPDGTVLTIDAYVFHYKANGRNYEIYNPSTGSWRSGPASGTIVQLWDSYSNAQNASYELGPAVLRPDGTVFATGATTAPGQSGHTAVYDFLTKTWTAGPDFPDGLDIADGPAALLPDGNVLMQTSPGFGNLGSRFFEWDGSALIDVTAGNTDAPNISSFYGNMLVLPTGEILFTDFGNFWVYRANGKPNQAWLPQITSVPTLLNRGHSYTISGYNFNGFSQGASYGDDVQGATNYPIVRLENRVTGHVFYARTHNHSTMGIAYSGQASTTFDVSSRTETGLSNIQVIANGIASPPATVNVR
jgi:hypothetical protein